jgi:glycosyltransferase involved in cell wall biosynthesis
MPAPSLRVAVVAGTLGQGGAERQLFYLTTTLHRIGVEVRVLSLTRGEYWEERLHEAGIAVEWVGQRAARAARLLAVTQAARRHRADLIQSFHFFANPYAALAARALGRPDLGAIRSSGQGDLDSVGPAMSRLCVRLPRVLVANSEAALTSLQHHGIPRHRLRMLPNVIDLDAFTPSAGRRERKPFTVVAIGRLSAQKRFDRALRVFARFQAAATTDVRLVIAGAGSEAPALATLTRELGLGQRVTFTGPLADVRPLLAEADCLLLTSDYEGTPNVILEAMASARPVVATAVGGVDALVEAEETGLLAEPDDEASLSAALTRLVKDPRLCARLGRQARLRVERRHSLGQLEDRILAIYRDVLPAPFLNRGGGGRP